MTSAHIDLFVRDTDGVDVAVSDHQDDYGRLLIGNSTAIHASVDDLRRLSEALERLIAHIDERTGA